MKTTARIVKGDCRALELKYYSVKGQATIVQICIYCTLGNVDYKQKKDRKLEEEKN